MVTSGEIKSEKILVKQLFQAMWFRIPEYQRPYVWGDEQVNELLEDLKFAMTEKPNSEYFLGSLVLQSKKVWTKGGQDYTESGLLDGQQRMATLLFLFAAIRDLTKDNNVKISCQESIYQKEDPYKGIPERPRLLFASEETQNFIEDYIVDESWADNKKKPGTERIENEASELNKKKNVSIQNMANAVVTIRKFFHDNSDLDLGKFLYFLNTKVLIIYVCTEDLEDAFRLFTILNDRGVQLRNSDILKAINLGELKDNNDLIRKYAQMWEEAEGELGEEFERFLNHVRTILVKDKPRQTLLKEFEDRIYKKNRLSKGQETFMLIEEYIGHYRTLLDEQYNKKLNGYEFYNLINVMLKGLPSNDWMPPLLCYFHNFKDVQLLDFLKLLDNKFSADWISQYPPDYRIREMNKIIEVIDEAKNQGNVKHVFDSKCFNIDAASFSDRIKGPVYGKGFGRYLLLKLDYFKTSPDQRMGFEKLSVEHILPQKPAESSQWLKDFEEDEREDWTDKLGNLVLITRRKNSELGRLDYPEKKETYFKGYIDTSPNSLRIYENYNEWTPKLLKENQEFVLNQVCSHYGIHNPN